VRLIPEAEPNEALRKIPPTLVLDVNDEMQIMQEEIFGPLLPIMTYRDLGEVIAYVNARPYPLAFYLFTHNKAIQERVVYHTLSGGVAINDCVVHAVQHDLPFGGIGNSGLGQYHAYEGFLEFSKLRPVFHQAPRTAVAFMYPPYGRTFERVYNWMMRLRRL
jgi:coniferyl-aldehyde dehydrogenase